MATRKRIPLDRNPSEEQSRLAAARFRVTMLGLARSIESGELVGIKTTWRWNDPNTPLTLEFGAAPRKAAAQHLSEPPTVPAVGSRWTHKPTGDAYEVLGYAWAAGSAKVGWQVLYRNEQGEQLTRIVGEWAPMFEPATVPAHPDLFAEGTMTPAAVVMLEAPDAAAAREVLTETGDA